MSRGERCLMLAFLVMAGGAAALALGFERPEARLFPLVAGTTTALMILLYLFVMSVPALKQALRPYLEDEVFVRITSGTGAGSDVSSDAVDDEAAGPAPLDDRTRHRRELLIFGFVVGLGVLSWLVGVQIAAAAFLCAVMLLYSRESLRLTLLVTAGTSVVLYLVFTVTLRLPPHFGLLGELW